MTPLLWLLYGLSATGIAADGISTARGLSRGAVETNVLLGARPSPIRLVAYNVVAEGLNVAVGKLPKVPRVLVWGLLATVEYGFAVHNLRLR
jgi:hypothetical protein